MPRDTKKEKKEKKHFLKDLKVELKKVIWPSPKQLVNNTVAVLVIVLITAAIVFVLDLVFEKVNTNVVRGLQNAISNSANVETETELGNTDVISDLVESAEDTTIEAEENTVIE